MSVVKEYKGVKIFVTPDGEFYCDTKNNNPDFKSKTFSSSKVSSIEKAIDDYEGEDIDGNSFYEIASYSRVLRKLKVVRRVGNRLFFDDGTDTTSYGRRELYPESIEQSEYFPALTSIFDDLQSKQVEINILYEDIKKLTKAADDIVKKFNTIKPY